MDRDADGARLIGDGTGSSLSDPPGGIGAEFVAAAVLKLLHGLHQAGIALLNQVEEGEAAVHVLLDDGDHEAQIGLDHLRAGGLPLAQRLAEARQALSKAEAKCADRLANLGVATINEAVAAAERRKQLVGRLDVLKAALAALGDDSI